MSLGHLHWAGGFDRERESQEARREYVSGSDYTSDELREVQPRLRAEMYERLAKREGSTT